MQAIHGTSTNRALCCAQSAKNAAGHLICIEGNRSNTFALSLLTAAFRYFEENRISYAYLFSY
jgi:hypothetical protein